MDTYWCTNLALLCSIIVRVWSKCDLPSDFWCDHASISEQCGAARYCATYRNNMRGQPFDIKVFLNGQSEDAQHFVTQKLYPNLVAHPKRATVNVYPISGSNRAFRSNNCEPTDEQCNVNRLLSCATHRLKGDKLYRFIFCVELSLKFNRTYEELESQCYRDVTSTREESTLKRCTKSSEWQTSLSSDEKIGRSLRPTRQRFLPWISINDKSLEDMQAYQSMLSTKLMIWSKVLRKSFNHSVLPTNSRCNMPPDFWCDSSEITNECFDAGKCAMYKSNVYGKPLQLTLIYAAHCPFSQATIVDNIFPNLWQNKQLRRFYRIKFLPYGNGKIDENEKITCQHGPSECFGNTIHDCVKAKTNYEESVEYIACHMREVREHRNDRRALDRCASQLKWSSSRKHAVLKCANSEEGHKLQIKTARASEGLEPELKHFAPWLVVNGQSTLEMQQYIPDLDKFVCRWYRGTTDQRNSCNICDYAPSRCK